MSQRFSQVIIIILSISILLLTLITNGLVWKEPTVKVVRVQEALILTDPQKINIFIDELLTTKSATCFRNILNAESNMRPKAYNKSTGAKGVGQLLSSTYHNIGLKHSGDPIAQVVASLAYISRHYGGSNAVCNAWQVERTKHFY